MKLIKNGGFTLIEMLVSVVILALLIAVVAPGFSELIKNNRMLSQVYAMRAALNGARSEALAQRNFVTLCRSADGASCTSGDWNTGFVAFLDDDGDGQVDDPNEQIVISKVLDVDTLSIGYSGGDWVQFDSRGYAAKGSQGTFTVCDDRGKNYARGLVISAGGLVGAAALDPNDPALCN
jgi:type IV fimbrial biogenesis protein FimT